MAKKTITIEISIDTEKGNDSIERYYGKLNSQHPDGGFTSKVDVRVYNQ